MSIKVTAKVGDIARGHCQNYFENVDMIGNSLGFLFERLALLNSFVTLIVMMSSSWHFPARAEPSYEGSEPSRAGHFNFRAETELNRNFFNSFFPKFLLSEILYHDFIQFYDHLSELLWFLKMNNLIQMHNLVNFIIENNRK